MQTSKSSGRSAKPTSSAGKRALKTGAVLAAVGLATLAVARGLKSKRGIALKKKAKAGTKRIVSNVSRAAKAKARTMTTAASKRTGARAR
jgi:hypothetical protein